MIPICSALFLPFPSPGRSFSVAPSFPPSGSQQGNDPNEKTSSWWICLERDPKRFIPQLIPCCDAAGVRESPLKCSN